MDIENALTIFGGVQAVMVALFAYLGKIWIERIEKVFEIKAHASKEQFTKEFEFYREIWGKMSEIRESIRSTIENKRHENVGALRTQTRELYLLVEANEPFFPEEFRDDLVKIRELATHWSEYVMNDKTDPLAFIEHLDVLNGAYNSLSKKIQERIYNSTKI